MYYYGEENSEENDPVFEEEPFIRPATPGVTKKSFKEAMKDFSKPICFFGAVPPPEKLGEDVALKSADSWAKSFLELKPDGIIVYDIQDEKSRSGEERPFPFSKTYCPRKFAKELYQRTHLETIVYQALIPERTTETFNEYLRDTIQDFGIKNVVFVGGGSNCSLFVPEASRLAMRYSDEFHLGGVTIPERHRDQKNEHRRVLEKSQFGVSYFTSQVIYNADNVIAFLRDYNDLCKQNNIAPARIMLAFAPFGRKGTLDFLRWLGVEVANGTAERVLGRGTTQLCIDESVQICWENLRRILDVHKNLRLQVPLGVAVESVSKFRDEQKAAEDLFKHLRQEMDEFYVSKNW